MKQIKNLCIFCLVFALLVAWLPVPARANADSYTVIGSIGGTNWDTDFSMTQDGDIWTSDYIEMEAGAEFKIRQGLSWDVNYGAGGVMGGANVVVETSGTYCVRFDASTGAITLIDMDGNDVSSDSQSAWTVIGSVGGSNWDTDFPMTQNGSLWFSDFLEMEAGAEFKVRQGLSWDVNYGKDGVLGGDNFYVNATGTYCVKFDASTGLINLIPLNSDDPTYAWTVIGSIGETNWDTDFPMTKDGTVWTSEPIDMAAGAEFKIRQGLSWDVNYGKDGVQGGENFVVETAGTYRVQFDASTGLISLVSTGPAVVASGTCGDNLTWTLDEDGNLTVTGTGEMESSPDWRNASVEITSVTVGDGATSIGYNAFYNCEKLEKVTLPDSITTIEGNAFVMCTSLSEINVPQNLKYVGDSAFLGCESLTSFDLPEGFEGYGTFNAFCGTGLTSLTLPSTVTNTMAYTYSGCTNLTELTLQEGLDYINWCSFYSVGISTLTVPTSVTAIDCSAFANCANLKTIYFLGDAPYIGTEMYGEPAQVFEGVTATAYYPAGNETWVEGVTLDWGGNITWVPLYSTLEGNDITWSSGAEAVTPIRVNCDRNAFVSVSLNDELVDRANYDVSEGSTVITFHEDYLATLPGGKYTVTITFTQGVALASLTIERTYIPGDINGDGGVNNKDLTRLFQYLSGYDVEVVEAALDVNGDGNVNNKDVTRLFQYLSGYDVEIE